MALKEGLFGSIRAADEYEPEECRETVLDEDELE